MKSDYSHYLYTQKIGDLGKYNLVNVFCSAVVQTIDDYFVLGIMNNHTAFPGKIQFCGGGLGNEDVSGDTVNLLNCIKRELAEELFIENKKPDFLDIYESFDEHKIAILFTLKLDISKEEFKNYFFNSKSLDSEFSNIIFVKNNQKSFSSIISDLNTENTVRRFFQNRQAIL